MSPRPSDDARFTTSLDPEKDAAATEALASDDGALREETLLSGDTWYMRVQRRAAGLGVESRGIERVPEHERTDTTSSKVATMWLSANMVVSSFAIGALAYPVFLLGFVDGLLAIIFMNVLGIFPACFYSTFGPRFGLRQMVLSRFWFGWHGVKVIAFFNCLACIGWSAVNTIVGAQLFVTVNPSMPNWIGVLIIAIGTFLITCFGYRAVHIYERYSWLPSFVVFLIVLGEFVKSDQFSNIPLKSGLSEAGAVLSFSASVFGFATGWSSFAADYTVYQPVDVNRNKIFAWTFLGLFFPLVFTQLLGLAVGTAMKNNVNYYNAYETTGIGGLLGQVLHDPLGRFGDFCLVILALSIIANNCPNIYSISLSLQVCSKWTANVPRFIWTAIGTLVYIAIAIPGYSHFEDTMENSMLIIAYWLAIYEGISLSDHFVYKRGFNGYDVSLHMTPSALPPGFAAAVAFCFGIAGGVLGMAQTFWTGPLGRLCGTEYGGDIGFPLAFAFSALSYVVLRSVELKIVGR